MGTRGSSLTMLIMYGVLPPLRYTNSWRGAYIIIIIIIIIIVIVNEFLQRDSSLKMTDENHIKDCWRNEGIYSTRNHDKNVMWQHVKNTLFKVKLSLCFNWAPRHEGVLRSGGIAQSILDLGWRWVIRFTPRPLYPQGKSSWYPLDRRLGGPQSYSGHGGEEKNSQPLPGL
jgi:hypothetical protein